eukprot:INCI3872.1.p1 GENE.INCI3872.1~~INCI3872.1.p1  ORF type:complete len:466 (+),score=83.79 INCI3872.1:119-1516(+)
MASLARKLILAVCLAAVVWGPSTTLASSAKTTQPPSAPSPVTKEKIAPAPVTKEKVAPAPRTPAAPAPEKKTTTTVGPPAFPAPEKTDPPAPAPEKKTTTTTPVPVGNVTDAASVATTANKVVGVTTLSDASTAPLVNGTTGEPASALVTTQSDLATSLGPFTTSKATTEDKVSIELSASPPVLVSTTAAKAATTTDATADATTTTSVTTTSVKPPPTGSSNGTTLAFNLVTKAPTLTTANLIESETDCDTDGDGVCSVAESMVFALGGTTNTILIFVGVFVAVFLLFFGIGIGIAKSAKKDKKDKVSDEEDTQAQSSALEDPPADGTGTKAQLPPRGDDAANANGPPSAKVAAGALATLPTDVTSPSAGDRTKTHPVPRPANQVRRQSMRLHRSPAPIEPPPPKNFFNQQPQSVKHALGAVFAPAATGKVSSAGAAPDLPGLNVPPAYVQQTPSGASWEFSNRL